MQVTLWAAGRAAGGKKVGDGLSLTAPGMKT